MRGGLDGARGTGDGAELLQVCGTGASTHARGHDECGADSRSVHLPQPAIVAEGQASETSGDRSVLYSEAHLHACFAGAGALASAFREASARRRRGDRPPRDAAAPEVLPLRQRLSGSAGPVGALRGGAPQLGRGGQADSLGSRAARRSACSAARQKADHPELHRRSHVLQAGRGSVRALESVHAPAAGLRGLREGGMDGELLPMLSVQGLPSGGAAKAGQR